MTPSSSGPNHGARRRRRAVEFLPPGRDAALRRIGLIAATAALVIVACTPNTTPSRSPDPSASASPTQNLSSPSAGSSSPVAMEASLLRILPATVAGLDVTESPEAESAALADPALAAVGSAMAAGIAVDPPTGEFVYAVVVRLKPGLMNDTMFRDWRDSYDQGACSQADGVAGHAESEIDGRTVYIGTCAGGLRTYHVWLGDSAILVSASVAGDHRLGEQLMNGLRP